MLSYCNISALYIGALIIGLPFRTLSGIFENLLSVADGTAFATGNASSISKSDSDSRCCSRTDCRLNNLRRHREEARTKRA